jgi:RES domain-containing protein
MEDLTKSDNVGVRWQAQMEEHLHGVRALSHEAMQMVLVPGVDKAHQWNVRVELAKANAVAAVALALANGMGDLEGVLSRLEESLRNA